MIRNVTEARSAVFVAACIFLGFLFVLFCFGLVDVFVLKTLKILRLKSSFIIKVYLNTLEGEK